MKMRIRRQKGHWIVEQNDVMVGWSRSFREVCCIAGEWTREGWVVAKGWYTR